MTISEKLKKIRTIKNLTQEQLAEELNIAFATVNRWEQGLTIPHGANKDKIEQYCKINGIMFDEEDNKNHISHMKIITASQLKNWFSESQNLARGLFPELVERLIKESCNKINKILFPSGDNVNVDGLDGELLAKSDNCQFIPDGHSFWELGATTITATKKINSDFRNRTKNTSQQEQKNTSFVLITPKTLTRKNKQQKKKELIKESHWKDIYIVDGIDLEEWLSSCFMTSVWLDEQFSNKKLNLNSLQIAKLQIQNETTPSMSLNLFTIAREQEIKNLYSLINTKQTIRIAGSSFFETYRFIISALSQNLEIANRVVICNDYATFTEIDNKLQNIIIVANFVFPHNVNLNSQNVHIIVLGKDINDLKYEILLTSRPQQALYDILKNDMKLESSKLQSIQHRANNNVMLIVRELASENFLCSNEWLKDPNIIDLIPITILGQINLKDDTEKNILSRFLPQNESVDSYVSNLKQHWENKDNSPLFVYNDQIKVILREEVWFACNNFISNKANEIFNVINEIFKNSNPKYNLPVEKQNFSSFYSLSWKFSAKTIEGLLDSLILLTIYNGKQDDVDIFVKKLLDDITSKEQMLTISQFLPLIAEAAPNIFGQFVFDCLKQQDSVLDHLFFSRTNNNILFGGHEYCELLWALEKLTYIDDTKFIACNCLFLLSERGYEYNISNNPKDSLITTLHWAKKNALSYKEKETVVNDIVSKNKEKAYYLPLELIKKDMISYSSTTLKWRNAILINNTPTYKEIFDSSKTFLQNILSSEDKPDVKIIKQMIDIQPKINFTSFDVVKNYILQNYVKENQDKLELYEYLQKKLYFMLKCQRNLTTKDLLDEFNVLIKHLKPKDQLKASLIYFKDFSYSGCPNKSVIDTNHENEEKKALEFRQNLMKKLLKKYPAGIVIDNIINVVTNNLYCGSMFYNIVSGINNVENIIVECGINAHKYELLSGFFNQLNPQIVDRYFDEMDYDTVKNIANFCYDNIYIPQRFLTDDELTKIVFSKRRFFNTENTQEKNLIKKYNPIGYICWIYRNKQNINQSNINEICDILISIDVNDFKFNNHIEYYEIQEILRTVDNEYYNEKVVQVCFKYLNFFEFNEIPNSIKTYFFYNPKEYIELITCQKFDASLVYHFDSFMTLPKGFYLEEQVLQNFIKTFMDFRNDDDNLINIVQSSLGQILARSFGHGETDFLSEEFMKIIENNPTKAFDIGVANGYFNSRGVRTIGDGSDEMKKYEQLIEQAKKYQIKYPESSKILKSIANDYYRNAIMDKETRLKIDGLL